MCKKPNYFTAEKEPFLEGLTSDQMDRTRCIPFITMGYRRGGSYKSSVLSIFSLNNNQSVNAWTMIIGSVFSSVFLVYCICGPLSANKNTNDHLPFVMCWLSCVLHTPCSVGNHLLLGMSSDVAILWKKIDVIGIFVVSVFLTFSLSYFVFTWTITLAVTFVSASIGTIASFKIARHKYTPGSVERFAHTTGVGVVVLVYMSPVVYITVIEWKYGMPLVTFIIVSISLILGGVVFANHWPECKYPRKFDIIGCSQTIMHILLIVAHLAEFLFVLDMFYAKHGHARLLN